MKKDIWKIIVSRYGKEDIKFKTKAEFDKWYNKPTPRKTPTTKPTIMKQIIDVVKEITGEENLSYYNDIRKSGLRRIKIERKFSKKQLNLINKEIPKLGDIQIKYEVIEEPWYPYYNPYRLILTMDKNLVPKN